MPGRHAECKRLCLVRQQLDRPQVKAEHIYRGKRVMLNTNSELLALKNRFTYHFTRGLRALISKNFQRYFCLIFKLFYFFSAIPHIPNKLKRTLMGNLAKSLLFKRTLVFFGNTSTIENLAIFIIRLFISKNLERISSSNGECR